MKLRGTERLREKKTVFVKMKERTVPKGEREGREGRKGRERRLAGRK